MIYEKTKPLVQELSTSGIDVMAEAAAEEVVAEILQIEQSGARVSKLSFAAHSAGNLTTRYMLNLPCLQPYLHRLQMFISMSGPHLGICPAPALMRVGASILGALGKGATLKQLSLSDTSDPKDGLLYRLSVESGTLHHFQRIVLMSSEQDG